MENNAVILRSHDLDHAFHLTLRALPRAETLPSMPLKPGLKNGDFQRATIYRPQHR
jgi:hypothetical protein